MILKSQTGAGWFAAASADLPALLSDHLHCERKAAENALSLIRRYPHRVATAEARARAVEAFSRLAHEETSHVVQVAVLMARRGWAVRPDAPNRYARRLLAGVRARDPERLLDGLVVAAFIEARSHERLGLLASGFDATGDEELAGFYRALANAEERHAEIFLELARPLARATELEERLGWFGAEEAEIIATLPPGPRVH